MRAVQVSQYQAHAPRQFCAQSNRRAMSAYERNLAARCHAQKWQRVANICRNRNALVGLNRGVQFGRAQFRNLAYLRLEVQRHYWRNNY
jgi:hypothetical protein